VFDKVTKYLGDVRQEMSKVMWPSRAELRESSTIVILLSLMLAIFTYGIDFILTHLLRLIIL